MATPAHTDSNDQLVDYLELAINPMSALLPGGSSAWHVRLMAHNHKAVAWTENYEDHAGARRVADRLAAQLARDEDPLLPIIDPLDHATDLG